MLNGADGWSWVGANSALHLASLLLRVCVQVRMEFKWAMSQYGLFCMYMQVDVVSVHIFECGHVACVYNVPTRWNFTTWRPRLFTKTQTVRIPHQTKFLWKLIKRNKYVSFLEFNFYVKYSSGLLIHCFGYLMSLGKETNVYFYGYGIWLLMNLINIFIHSLPTSSPEERHISLLWSCNWHVLLRFSKGSTHYVDLGYGEGQKLVA